MKTVALALFFAAVVALPSSAGQIPQTVAPGEMTPKPAITQQVSQACCKVCRKGKACGNSCISRAKTCRKPPGCACDGR